MSKLKYYRGSSLVELLLATALGIWLISGLIICYLTQQKTYHYAQALAHMQENGRIAIHLLTQDIHMAGYVGCLSLDSLAFNPDFIHTHFVAATRLLGWHNHAASTSFVLPASIKNNAVLDSDILLIQSMVPDNVQIVSAVNKTITFLTKPDYEVGDELIIADCVQANIVRITAVQDKKVIITPVLIHTYDRTSQIGHLASVFYYIRPTTRKNVAGMPIYGLYRRDMNNSATQAQEIAEGVEKMTLTFGIKHNHAINYQPIEQISSADWPVVVSVQITLSLNSIESNRKWQTTIATREPIFN